MTVAKPRRFAPKLLIEYGLHDTRDSAIGEHVDMLPTCRRHKRYIHYCSLIDTMIKFVICRYVSAAEARA